MGWVDNATPRPLYPRVRPGRHCIGGWVGPRVGLNGCGKSRPHQESTAEVKERVALYLYSPFGAVLGRTLPLPLPHNAFTCSVWFSQSSAGYFPAQKQQQWHRTSTGLRRCLKRQTKYVLCFILQSTDTRRCSGYAMGGWPRVGTTECFLLRNAQTGCTTHPVSYSMSTRDFERQGCEPWLFNYI